MRINRNRVQAHPSVQACQAVRGDEILSVADHQHAAAGVFLAECREVGIVGIAREVDHEDIEMAGEEGNHAVGKGILRQQQTGTGLPLCGGFLVQDEEQVVGAIQEGTVFILFGQVFFADEARFDDGSELVSFALKNGVAAVVSGFPDLQRVGRDEGKPCAGVGGAVKCGNLFHRKGLGGENLILHPPGLHDGGIGRVSTLGGPMVVGAVVDVLPCLMQLTEGAQQLYAVDVSTA